MIDKIKIREKCYKNKSQKRVKMHRNKLKNREKVLS